MNLDGKVQETLRRGGRWLKRNAATSILIAGMSATTLLNSCEERPEPEPEPDPTEQTYKLTYDAESSQEDKKLKDGKAYFIADESNDTLFSNLDDGQATIDITTEDEGIGGKAGVKNIPGHENASEDVYLEENQTIHLTPEATKHTASLDITTTYAKAAASNIEITINDSITDTTNTEGELTIPWQRATDEYNLPVSEQIKIHAESTPASNITTDPKDYTKNIDENNEEWTLELDRSTYDHNWNGNITSSKDGKTIKDGTDIGLVLDSNQEDTTWTTTTNQTYSLEQTLYDEETGYELIIKNAPGHDDKKTTGTSNGTNNDDITLQAQTYNATIPLHIESDGQAIPEATITHDEGTTTTGTDGNATIEDNNLETNTYNEPHDNYNQTITTEAEGYEEEQTSISYTQGDNDTQTITLQPTTYEYWLHGNTNAPGTEVKGWKDGEATFTATSNNGQYETNHETSTQEEITLDSIVANAEGYEKTKILDVTMQPGGTEQDLNLEEEPQNNTYTEKTIFANQTADEYDDGLVFIIKTRSDDQEHHTDVTSNEQVQQITLEGPYEPTDSIELYYTEASAAAQGKEDKILTITRNYEQPTASNGNRTSTLTTTIGDLFNQKQDTTWILSLNTELYENDAFRTHVAGGKEWVYSENGKRTMTINAITRSVDISEGTYEDDLTTEEMQALRDRTQLFKQEFWNRETGLKILNVNQEEPNTYQTNAGNINAFYDRTEQQPGNYHSLKETDRYMTYDFGGGHVPQGTEMYLGQLTGETIQAVAWIFDDESGGIGIYAHDENDKPYFTREDDVIVPFTYVGGKAPKP